MRKLLILILFILLLIPSQTAYAWVPGTVSLEVGESRTVNTESGGYEYIWYIDPKSDQSVISIQGNGSKCEITAKKPGQVIVRCQIKFKSKNIYYGVVYGPWMVEDDTPRIETDSLTVIVTNGQQGDKKTEVKVDGKKGEDVSGTIDDIMPCAYGGFAAACRNGLWGLVDKDLQLVIPFQFEYASSYGGFFAAKQNGANLLYNTDGKLIAENYKSKGHGFCNLFVDIEMPNKKGGYSWIYIDSNGKEITEEEAKTIKKKNGAEFEERNYIVNGFSGYKVWYWEDSSYYDETDMPVNIVFPEGYESAYEDMSSKNINPENTVFLIQKDGLYGLIDIRSNIVVEAEYSFLSDPSWDGYLSYKKDGICGIVSLTDMLNHNVVLPVKTVKPDNKAMDGEEASGNREDEEESEVSDEKVEKDTGETQLQEGVGYLVWNNENDYRKAMQLFKESAAKNNSMAMFYIGYLYERGKGVDADLAEAFNWYQKSAEKGNPAGQFQVAYFYDVGWNVKKSAKNAVKWYKKAESQEKYITSFKSSYYYKDIEDVLSMSVLYAKYNLAWKYQNGIGTDKDYKAAMELYKECAAAGDDVAMYRIGRLYEKGLGVAKNQNTALKWYQKAAAAGNKKAAKQIKNK